MRPTFPAGALGFVLLCGMALPAAALDMSRHPICSSYAKAAATYDREAASRGCRVKAIRGNLGGNEVKYYNFCMRTSDAQFRVRSPVAAGHKQILMRECTRQLHYEFPL